MEIVRDRGVPQAGIRVPKSNGVPKGECGYIKKAGKNKTGMPKGLRYRQMKSLLGTIIPRMG